MGEKQGKTRLNLLSSSESFVKDLQTALRIPPDTLGELADYLNTDDGIDVRDEERLFEIWGKASLPTESLKDALSVIKHLFDRIIEQKVEFGDALEELRVFCAQRKIEGFDDETQPEEAT